MLDLDKLILGNYDIILGLNSLYYLNPQELTQLLISISKITEIIIIECRIGKPFKNESSNEKASINYMIKTLNGRII